MTTEESKVIRQFKPFRLGFCRCGCGTEIPLRRGTSPYLTKFEFNHHFRLKENKRDQTGEKNLNWKGGQYIHKGQYTYLKKPNHPNADKNGYVTRHVFVYTEYYKCCMLSWSIIHHIDENKHNDKIENLQGMVRNKHISHHQTKRKRNKYNLGDRICLLCNSIDTYINKKTSREIWYKYKDGFICLNCYNKNRE